MISDGLVKASNADTAKSWDSTYKQAHKIVLVNWLIELSVAFRIKETKYHTISKESYLTTYKMCFFPSNNSLLITLDFIYWKIGSKEALDCLEDVIWPYRGSQYHLQISYL